MARPRMRERLLAEGMRLFGEKGYAATSVAEIERAAGLAAGSGSLYRHFGSKRELLESGIDALLAERDSGEEPVAGSDLPQRLRQVAVQRMVRMQEDQNLNRLLFRDLTQFPELLVRFAEGEVKRRHEWLADFVAAEGGSSSPGDGLDWEALACVLHSAIAHYWLMSDVFGVHPTHVDQSDYIAALVQLAVAAVSDQADALG